MNEQKKDNGIYNYLDCSTGHITEEDNDFLEIEDSIRDRNSFLDLASINREVKGSGLLVIEHSHGYWVHVPSDKKELKELIDAGTVSKTILAVVQKAHDAGCFWINFDADGFEHDDLETFDWPAPPPGATFL